MSRKIEVQILGDSKQLEAALGRASKKTSTFGSALAAGAKVGAAGLLGLGVAAKIGFSELVDSQKVAAQTAAVIKSTGGAANVTAGHVNTLSQSLLQLSGVDDEAIAGMENMLLTFRNIHNEAGRTNDVFDQATKATLDLSVAMGKDLSSSAILVGKALNDPEKGMTALRRVGVSFTKDQEALIKKLVETGNTMEAQKLILGELNQEFGGSAEAAGKTLPAQLSKLREAFADVAAQLVGAVLPATLQLVGVLTTATAWMKRNQEATKVLVIAIAALSTGLIAAKIAYALANSSLIAFVRSIRIGTIAVRLFTAANIALDVAMSANPVVALTVAILALGVALVIAYKKSETFRNIVNSAIDSVKAHWKLLLFLIPGIGPVLAGVASQFDNIKSAVMAVVGAIKSLIGWIHSIPSIPNPFGGGAANPIPPRFGGTTTTDPGVVRAGADARPLVANLYLDGKLVYQSMVSQDKISRRQTGRSLLA